MVSGFLMWTKKSMNIMYVPVCQYGTCMWTGFGLGRKREGDGRPAQLGVVHVNLYANSRKRVGHVGERG